MITGGAGDTVFSLVSILVNNTKKDLMLGPLSSIAVTIKTQILGHKSRIKSKSIENYFKMILK